MAAGATMIIATATIATNIISFLNLLFLLLFTHPMDSLSLFVCVRETDPAFKERGSVYYYYYYYSFQQGPHSQMKHDLCSSVSSEVLSPRRRRPG
jgi:hypothetical protein